MACVTSKNPHAVDARHNSLDKVRHVILKGGVNLTVGILPILLSTPPLGTTYLHARTYCSLQILSMQNIITNKHNMS